MASVDLSGVHVPVVTPMDPEGEVDAEGFRHNLCTWSTSGVVGVVVGGSTGEAVLLDAHERQTLWETAVDEVGDDLLVTAGTGAESTRTTLRMCRAAAGAGAGAVLVQPPAFFRTAMTEAALERHYLAVADASPVPVIVYQVPLKMSTLEFSTGLVAGLAEHENIVGIKDSRGRMDLLEELVAATPDGFQVLVGNGAIFLDALRVGAVGGILGVANVAPDECARIHQHVEGGEPGAAERLQAIVAPLHNGIVGARGVPGVKAAVAMLGNRAGAPRPPLSALDDEGRRDVRGLLEDAELL